MPFFESVAENAFAGEACAEADFLNGQRRILQQIPGGSHPPVHGVFMGRIACFLLEHPDEIIGAQAGNGGQLLN